MLFKPPHCWLSEDMAVLKKLKVYKLQLLLIAWAFLLNACVHVNSTASSVFDCLSLINEFLHEMVQNFNFSLARR